MMTSENWKRRVAEAKRNTSRAVHKRIWMPLSDIGDEYPELESSVTVVRRAQRQYEDDGCSELDFSNSPLEFPRGGFDDGE